MIQDFLRFFNIKLVSLANYLEISADNMRSIHSGRRSFTMQHILWLQVLKDALQLHIPSDQIPEMELADPKQQEKFNQTLKKYIHQQSKLIAGKEYKLEKSKLKYNDLQRGLNACQRLLKQGGVHPNHQKWCDLRRRHLGAVLTDLRLYIGKLEAEIQAANIQKEVFASQVVPSKA